jgi:GT2 family glycosyltransferase
VSHRPRIVLLGMMTKMPVAGVVWQTIHYLVGLRRLGFDVYYVESHARTPSMLMAHEHDDSSALAAAFIDKTLRPYDLASKWAFHALHDDGRVYGMSAQELRRLYRSAELVINLHGGTDPLPEHAETGRLVYLETDPVLLQIELHDNLERSIAFLEPHVAFFTFAENLGRPGCKLPVSNSFSFLPTRQPVVTEFWLGAEDSAAPITFTTVGNWRQSWRSVAYLGEQYTWSKHEEFLKFLDVPKRSQAPFELALASLDEDARRLLEDKGWSVKDALAVSTDLDSYREYIRRSGAEFTVAKDQNVRLRTGWFSDRSATYLAAGRPVVTQDTGFGDLLPVGAGLFAFTGIDEIVEAVGRIRTDYAAQRRSAFAIAREFFDSDVVLTRLLDDCGTSVPGHRSNRSETVLPLSLPLVPEARRPLRLSSKTTDAALARPLPWPELGPPPIPRASIVVVTMGNLALTRLCLETVLATTSEDVEVVVVDNASTDGTREYLDALVPRSGRVHAIQNPANRGFAGAVNQGLAASRGEVLVVLNNDTLVPPGWLERLEHHLQDLAVGLVGPTTNEAGNEAELETPYRTYGEMLEFAKKQAIEADRRLADVPVATMFCAALRRDVLEAVGPLDERFEVGLFEDDDYSARVKAAGYRVALAEDAFVHHFGEASFGELYANGRRGELFEANRRRFEEKWGISWSSHERRAAQHYRDLVERIREAVDREVPADATVLVVSNGDEELLRLGGSRRGWHFPQMEDGVHAGHHPANSADAIAQFESLRQQGADHLLLPDVSLWWLDFYDAFAKYLRDASQPERHCDGCIVYGPFQALDPAHGEPLSKRSLSG